MISRVPLAASMTGHARMTLPLAAVTPRSHDLRLRVPIRMPYAGASGTCTAASTGASAVSRNSESPALTRRSEARRPAVTTPANGATIRVSSRSRCAFCSAEHGFAKLELDPLRIGLGDHAGGLERPLSLTDGLVSV